MSIASRALRLLEPLIRRQGLELVPSGLVYPWQRRRHTQRSHSGAPLPPGAREVLHPANPRLLELTRRYQSFGEDATVPLTWKDDHLRAEDIPYFRGDNAFVWQLRGRNMNELGYALTALYVQAIDHCGYLERLGEDDAFGNFTFQVMGQTVSRDLLDSINELYLLDRQWSIASQPGLRVLDIGAGYGRLAHRMAEALPNLGAYLCTDAVPASTFLSEYYLAYRGQQARARVVPLDDIDAALAEGTPDLAVNIHSFSECSLPAINWWLELLDRHRVPRLLVAPNPVTGTGDSLLTNDHQDFGVVIARHGYRQLARVPKFSDPVVQRYGLDPTFYYFFERAP